MAIATCRVLRLARKPGRQSATAMSRLRARRGIQEGGRIGRHVEDFTLRDQWNRPQSLADFADAQLVVLAFLGTECPLAQIYAPRLVDAGKA